MAKRASKRRTSPARAARRVTAYTHLQPLRPNLATGAIDLGAFVGRAVLRFLDAAGRLSARAPAPSNVVAEPSVNARRLPEAKLTAIGKARRRSRSAPITRRIPSARKPLGRVPSRTGQPTAKRQRRSPG